MSQNLRYYVYLDEEVQGPHELDALKQMNLSGDIKVCPEGSTEWIEYELLENGKDSLDFVKNVLQSPVADDIPSKVGKYAVEYEIGRGGMGSVYLATDEVLNRKVAIKELKIDDQKKKNPDSYETLIKRFKREAQVLAQLNHKNIVSIFDIVVENQSQFIIMEYLDGMNLEELLERKKRLSIDEAVSIVSDTCLALDYIHKKNIIHRDVKPSNIVIMQDGVVKLTDFGVTRDLNSSTMTMTKDGSLVGTIAYASPEQDSRDLDGRSDIFSLGVVLYELVTGEKPFTGDTIASVLLKIATKDPVKPSELNRDVHKMLENIILKAMSKSLGQRYSTAMEMHNDLQKYKEAIEKNDSAVLSGLKSSSDKSFNSSIKVDSIPPGKFQAKDFYKPKPLEPSIPPGSMNVETLKENNNSLDNSNENKEKELFPKMIDYSKGVNKVPQSASKFSNTNNLSEEQNNFDINNTPVNPFVQPKKNSSHQEKNEASVDAETSVKKSTDPNLPNLLDDLDNKKRKKTKKKNKLKSHVSEQMEKELIEKRRKVLIPLLIASFLLLLLASGFINFLDFIILGITLSGAYYDYYTAKVSKWITYSLMIVSIALVFFIVKTIMPSFENEKIGSGIYYLLDISLFLISFIGAFIIMKVLDFMSINKRKVIRPLGGIFKSLIAILSIILIVSFTDIVNDPFIQEQFTYSKVANAMALVIPNFELGQKSDLELGQFGLKIN